MTGVLQPMSHKFTSVCGWNSGASANLHQRSVSPKLCHGQKATNHCRSGCCATTQRKDNGWSWDLTTKTKMVNGCFLGTRPFESFRSSEPLWMDDQSSYCWVIHGQGWLFHRISGNVPSLRDRQGFFNPRHINLRQFVAEIPVPMPIFISSRSAQNCVEKFWPRTIATDALAFVEGAMPPGNRRNQTRLSAETCLTCGCPWFIELDDGKILTGKPDQFDGKNM